MITFKCCVPFPIAYAHTQFFRHTYRSGAFLRQLPSRILPWGLLQAAPHCWPFLCGLPAHPRGGQRARPAVDGPGPPRRRYSAPRAGAPLPVPSGLHRLGPGGAAPARGVRGLHPPRPAGRAVVDCSRRRSDPLGGHPSRRLRPGAPVCPPAPSSPWREWGWRYREEEGTSKTGRRSKSTTTTRSGTAGYSSGRPLLQ